MEVKVIVCLLDFYIKIITQDYCSLNKKIVAYTETKNTKPYVLVCRYVLLLDIRGRRLFGNINFKIVQFCHSCTDYIMFSF